MRRVRFTVCLSLLTTAVVSVVSSGAEPGDQSFSRGASEIDVTSYLDANSLLMFVSNIGWLAHDPTRSLGRRSGLYFPKGEAKTLIFAGGLWIAAQVDGRTRCSAAEYAVDYAPGPMEGGTFLPDEPRFRVYKIRRGDTPQSNPDYADWPFDLGAPALRNHAGGDSLDDFGRRIPLLLGDQTLWTVFNDVDTLARRSDPGSSGIRPLGVEVKVLAWGYDVPAPLGQIVFLHYTIINDGVKTLLNSYVALWADADLGDARDDLVGCDSALSLGFCYNDGLDLVYGSAPPAVGFDLLQGPVIPSLGDSAWSFHDGSYRHDVRALPMTAFNAYGNGEDPDFDLAAYYYMRGRARGGEPAVDPTNGDTTTFILAGDPVAGAGWLDTLPGDRRFLISTGPFNMPPGDTQEVCAAVIVGQGDDAVASVGVLREVDRISHALYAHHFEPPLEVPVDLLPGQCPNILVTEEARELFLPRSAAAYPKGEISVAVLGGDAFDVASIEPVTLALEGVGPIAWSMVDVSSPIQRESLCDCYGSAPDGFPDLVARFRRDDVLAALGTLKHREMRRLTLTGLTHEDRFLLGSDCMVIYTDVQPIPADQIGEPGTGLPTDVRFLDGYPNPFNAATTISFLLNADADVRLEVFDILGRRVRTLLTGRQTAGSHQIVWDGRDDAGRTVSTGVYFCRIDTGSETSNLRIVLLK